ncbi:MAG: bifunctional tetrahydrofolate synthase/dihydrofolate synthase [Ottowia sp.]|nr:bifunctional tetrahydrofolate synthase/dihydrofolate synthase [Ottowia sp.]
MKQTSDALPHTLDGWLQLVEQRSPERVIDLGLERVRAVAARMGLRVGVPVFTVAGTNGKGSVCVLLEAMLRAAGSRTGVYTSPHLLRFEERCRIDGANAAAEVLAASFARVEAARGDAPLSYFEFTTLGILDALTRAGVDALILEVGLGGRLDAVNIVDADCAILTSVGLDHTHLLGATREDIGREKAGIMRAGRPAIICGAQPPASVLAHAADIGADAWLAGRDFTGHTDGAQWRWAGRGQRVESLPLPTLPGAHQLGNAAGAIAALQAMKERLPVPEEAMRAGLRAATLTGRLQVLQGQPQVVLDVAHNPQAAAALAQALRALDAAGAAPRTHAVFGAMADKDVAGVLAIMDELVDCWYFCGLPTPRAAGAQQLLDIWRSATKRAEAARAAAFDTPAQALDAATHACCSADRIIVFGSFYTVAGVLAQGAPRIRAGQGVTFEAP